MKYIVVNLLLSVCVINSSINSKVPAILSNYSNLNSHNTRVNKDEDKDKDNSNSVLRIMFAQGFNKSPSDLVDLGLVNSKENKINMPKPGRLLERNNDDSDDNNDNTEKAFGEWIHNIVGSSTTVANIPEDCPKCLCGTSNIPNRIVGGQDAKLYQYPWMSYLTYHGRFYCAATIISSKYMLTAAHCVDRFDKSKIKVHTGAYDRNNASSQLVEYKILSVIKHSGYSITNYNNDLALIKINGVIKFDGPMKPVCLPERGSTFTGKNATVTGWGAIEESGPLSSTLQEVLVPIMSNNECRTTKYPPKRITDNMLCAGYIDGGKDSCQGDSGGPLHVVEDKTYKIVGIVSWGEGCALPGYPGVYTRVNRYISWIERNTKDSCFC
ncbi:trypsin-1-like [Microplitis demolitor]|uniref:trypsin-1-like n=1 Tax=Microplitis demolitor TaxID=69319 RepID=UPI0004CD2597|nr:trypsin-1-like [Microplitis demolitor]